jgi:glycolate oxidase FAD binding subunit
MRTTTVNPTSGPTASATSDWLVFAQDTIRQARATKTPLVIRGHGSKDFYGQPSPSSATILSTTDHAGVVDYDPTELVVVVKSGTPITALESVLAASQQMLAFEPPRFGGQGTVGGMMATGLSGPRRLSAGAAKDFVLGMTVLDDQATPMRYGGTVMKNVAGYDLSRLHTGAFGTLGLIVDVSLKVLPLPPAQATICFDVSAEKAITLVNTWGGQPLPISATSWWNGQLMVRLAGAVAAVNSAKERLGGSGVPNDQADVYWQRLRDHADPFFALDTSVRDCHLWRLSLPSVTPHLSEFDDPQWIEWGGALRWIKTNASPDRIREVARQHGGHATLFRAAASAARADMGAFTPVSPAIMKIHQRLKQELDSHGIFNPGRLYPGL